MPDWWFFMLGMVCLWAGLAVQYGATTWAYVTADVEPVIRGGYLLAARLVYLAMILTGGAFFIAASQRERVGLWPAFWIWSICMACFTLALAARGI